MSQTPVSINIYIGDIPEEFVTDIFDYIRMQGSNFSFSVGDPLELEAESVEELTGDQEVSRRDIRDGTTCPTCILPIGHIKDCGPAWDPQDNR